MNRKNLKYCAVVLKNKIGSVENACYFQFLGGLHRGSNSLFYQELLLVNVKQFIVFSQLALLQLMLM